MINRGGDRDSSGRAVREVEEGRGGNEAKGRTALSGWKKSKVEEEEKEMNQSKSKHGGNDSKLGGKRREKKGAKTGEALTIAMDSTGFLRGAKT